MLVADDFHQGHGGKIKEWSEPHHIMTQAHCISSLILQKHADLDDYVYHNAVHPPVLLLFEQPSYMKKSCDRHQEQNHNETYFENS
jgi:hypothetical protein